MNPWTTTSNERSLTRRELLRLGALSAGALSLSLPESTGLATPASARDVRCILLFLVGGPSHLDTWDLKPDAPAEIRGPFRPRATQIPGMQISEHFPKMARLAQHYALVRSVHHDDAPIHETGQQLLQTGRVFRQGHEYPHYGAVVSQLQRDRANGMPPWVILPTPIGDTGVGVSHGQSAGSLGDSCAPRVLQGNLSQQGLSEENDKLRDRYGRNPFGQSCLLARRLIERGVRVATVNMFDAVFEKLSWDCHADGGALPTTLQDYADRLCPMFDAAYATLLDDLHQRGLLETTLVLAGGEFGRTPRLNPRGGRDHWPGCWTVLFAGGGVRGGQVIGSSDAHGIEPNDRPVTPAEIAATVYSTLGIPSSQRIPGPQGEPIPLITAKPIHELFGI